jgi:hypothetical protein
MKDKAKPLISKYRDGLGEYGRRPVVIPANQRQLCEIGAGMQVGLISSRLAGMKKTGTWFGQATLSERKPATP